MECELSNHLNQKKKNNNCPFCEPKFAHVLEFELSFAYTVSVVHQNNVKF